MQNYNNLSPKMINRTLLSLQGNQYTIYTNGIIISGQSVSIAPSWVLLGFQPENTEQSLKHSTNLHRTPCTSYNAYVFYPKCTKKPPKFWTKRTKTDPRTAWKAFKTAQKSLKQVKLNKIFLSHYQGVEVLEQKKDFKIFGQNRKRQYFCNPKRRGKQGERMRGSRRGD